MGLFNNDHEPPPPGRQLLFWGIGAYVAALAVIYRHLQPDQTLAFMGLPALMPLLTGFCLWKGRFQDQRDARWAGTPDWLSRFDFDTYWLGYFGVAFLSAAALDLAFFFNLFR
jgi:hypothetical protein